MLARLPTPAPLYARQASAAPTSTSVSEAAITPPAIITTSAVPSPGDNLITSTTSSISTSSAVSPDSSVAAPGDSLIDTSSTTPSPVPPTSTPGGTAAPTEGGSGREGGVPTSMGGSGGGRPNTSIASITRADPGAVPTTNTPVIRSTTNGPGTLGAVTGTLTRNAGATSTGAALYSVSNPWHGYKVRMLTLGVVLLSFGLGVVAVH